MKNKNNNETEQKPKTATILFVDLVGSSEYASIKKTNEYVSDYVSHFQKLVLNIFKHNEKFCGGGGGRNNENPDGDFIDYNVRGDEGFFIISSKPQINDSATTELKISEKDILSVLGIALRIKYEWLFEQINIDRLGEMKQPFDIAIGINTGEIRIVENNEEQTKKYVAEGYAINLAKRIEGLSRSGDFSGIFVSEHTFGYYNSIGGENSLRFKQQSKKQLKGISGNVSVYELIFANLEDDDEILKIPNKWYDNWEATKENISSLKKYFDDTLNPWIGNVLSNIKWRKFAKIFDEELPNAKKNNDEDLINDLKKQAEKYLSDSSEIVRKIIEIDPNTSIWKVYLSQILFDYLYYDIVDENKIGTKIDGYGDLLINDTMELLDALINNEPHELDGKLYLGKYYLEIKGVKKMIPKDSDDFKKVKKSISKSIEKAMQQFQRIIIWDDEYPDAYYYLSGAMIQLISINYDKIDSNNSKQLKKKDKLEIDKAFGLLKMGIKYSGAKVDEKMKNHAKEDKLFKPVWGMKRFKEIVGSKT